MTTPPDQNSQPHPLDIYGDINRITEIFRWFIAVILLSLSIGTMIAISANDALPAAFLAISMVPVAATFILVKQKKIELASILLALTLFTLMTVLATNGSGIHQVSNLAFPAILIIASLVTKKRTLFILTLYTIGCVAWLVFGELYGTYAPIILMETVPADFFAASLAILATAFMARLLTETLFQSNLQLQNELRERKLAEEKYRNIFENAIDGIFQSTTDGRFMSVNPAMAHMYGYDSPEEMVQSVTDIASQIYVEPGLRNALRRRLAEGEKIAGFESQEYRKDGSTLWSSMNAQAIHDFDGNILYYEGTVEDVTRRKKMEIKGKEVETLYRTLVEQTSIVVYRDAPDGSASSLYVSPQIETLLGYTANEWLSDAFFWKTRVHPQDLPMVLEDVKNYISTKDKSSLEYRMQTKAGDWRWVRDEAVIVKDEAGNAQFVHGVLLDITERKQAEDSLLQFRKLMDESNDAFYLINPQTSQYMDFNRSAYEKLGYSREELSHLGVIDIAEHVTSMDVWKERVALVREKGGLIFEANYRRKDGTIFPTEVSTRILDYLGETILVANVRDITERKRAEESLRESEKRYKEAQEIGHVGSWEYDIRNGGFWGSDEGKRVYGFNSESDIFTVEQVMKCVVDRDRVDQALINLIEKNEPYNIVFDIIRLNSAEKRTINSIAELVRDEDGNPVKVTGVLQDITERRQAEAALRASEERFHKIFSSSPIAICITTLDDGILLDANNAYWNITGYSPETSIGRTAEELKLWDSLQERQELVQELKQKLSVSKMDDYFFHMDGSLKRVMSFYELILIGDQECIISMFHDMSIQKQLEYEQENLIRELAVKNAESETLRESFASLVGTLEFTVIIEHILDQIGRVIPFDSASVWRLEGNVQKLIASQNLPPDNSIEEMEIKVDEINSARPILRGDVPYILNHNVQDELLDFKDPPHNIINSWLAIPLKTRGKIIGLIALDGHKKSQFNEHHAQLAVTFANQVAIALENAHLFGELQNELFTREKLIKELEAKNTELERFTYTVSHDLKSPLVTINGFLGYLKGDTASGNSERVALDVQRIQDAVDKMHLLLRDLLELSRIGRIMNPAEEIPLGNLVYEVLEIVHGRLEERGVTVLTQPDLPAVHGDRQRLTEVLQNLVDNAAKYMGDQTAPRIEIGQHGEEDGDKLIFYVRDNGMGIPNEHHERIFGLFDKLDPKSDGTGVGLALVKRIIEVHGGRIWVESKTGTGSTFYFTIPRARH